VKSHEEVCRVDQDINQYLWVTEILSFVASKRAKIAVIDPQLKNSTEPAVLLFTVTFFTWMTCSGVIDMMIIIK
jgi:hypothetical protein